MICDNSKLNDKGCSDVPDWIIESVSPASRQMDYFTKLFKYQTAGVKEYWSVDTQKDSVMVYRFAAETMEQYSFEDDVSVGK